MSEEKTATDVISISQFRSLIQDTVQQRFEEHYIKENQKALHLENCPVITGEDYPVKILIDDEEHDYSLNDNSGLVIFDSPPPPGLFTAIYYSAELTDEEIEASLDNALYRHLPGKTWDDFFDEEENQTDLFEQFPYISMLAGSSAYYQLSSKWAEATRIRTDDIEIHDQEISRNYFRLGEQMETRYQDASAGIIEVSTVTRRDVDIGHLIPLPEEVYNG